MSSNENNSSIKALATIAGLIVSCIAIFTFITGYATLREFLGLQPNANPSDNPSQPSFVTPANTLKPENVVPNLSVGYLFTDDFENGIKTDWFAIDGDWRMINGNLQGVSGQRASIGIGSNTWRNYTIEASIGGLRNTVSSARQFLETNPNVVFFGIRQSQNASTGYWFGVSHWKQECSFDRNFEEVIKFHSVERYLNERQSHTVKIEVSGDLFRFSLNGETVCSFSDSSVENGIVVISMFPGTGAEPSYPWVEYINISEK
jgi:hypothetical protein